MEGEQLELIIVYDRASYGSDQEGQNEAVVREIIQLCDSTSSIVYETVYKDCGATAYGQDLGKRQKNFEKTWAKLSEEQKDWLHQKGIDTPVGLANAFPKLLDSIQVPRTEIKEALQRVA